MRRAAALLAALALLARPAATRFAVGSPMSGTDVYYSSASEDLTVIAQRVSWGSGDLQREVPAGSAEACGRACRDAGPECAWYNYSKQEDGSSRCTLLSSGCSVAPLVGEIANGTGPERTAGFPIRFELMQGPNFEALSAQGVSGNDLQCPENTVLPGQCALRSTADAMRLCSSLDTCGAIVHYRNGTDGCSEPVSLLVSRGLTPLSSFVAPSVATLTKMDDSTQLERLSMLLAPEGNVTEPPPAELQAAAASGAPTAFLGCVVASSVIMAGAVVEVLDGVATPAACCRACRNDTACNTWNHCSKAGGCSFVREPRIVQLEQNQCELRFNDIATPDGGWPAAVIAKGAGVDFTGGAPLSAYAPPLPGFTRLPGHMQFELGAYQCHESVRPEMKECVVQGTPEELGQRCLASAECAAVVMKPGWMGQSGAQTLAVFKQRAANTTSQGLGPAATLYVRDAPPAGDSGSSLSAGAIAGIAVGAAAAAVVAAVLAGWLLQRRRRRQQRTASDAAIKMDGGNAAADAAEKGGTASSGAGSGSTAAVRKAVVLQPPARSSGTGSHPGMQDSGSLAAPSVPSSPPHPSSRSFQLKSPFAVSPFAAAAARRAASQALSDAPTSVSPTASATPSATAAASLGGLQTTSFGTVRTTTSVEQPRSSSNNTLPELAEHVAQVDMLAGSMGSGGGGTAGGALLTERSILSPTTLPSALRDWLVSLDDVVFVTHHNGSLVELGRGASATVYKCLLRGETVAAKELQLGRSAEDQQAFLAEAERLHQLRHAHIVQLYGICLSGPRGLLLMEYCGGRDLHSAVQVRKAGSDKRLFGWYARGRHVACEVAGAVNYLHAKSIVHMDIKSSNVLLTNSGAAKLADVGLSRHRQGTFVSALSGAVGTFAWMAPEIILGQRCTAAVDIFSFGVLLWEIVTGERPHRGEMRLPRVPDECPQQVADLIVDCMKLDPEARPSARQLLERLQALL